MVPILTKSSKSTFFNIKLTIRKHNEINLGFFKGESLEAHQSLKISVCDFCTVIGRCA